MSAPRFLRRFLLRLTGKLSTPFRPESRSVTELLFQLLNCDPFQSFISDNQCRRFSRCIVVLYLIGILAA